MRQSGFTLLELSIVLVIIGLIIGGVTVGAELIQQAALKSVVQEKIMIETSMRTFRLKYNALAGDFDRASDHWQVPTTYNGDNDGKLEYYTGGTVRDGIDVFRHLNWSKILPHPPVVGMTGGFTENYRMSKMHNSMSGMWHFYYGVMYNGAHNSETLTYGKIANGLHLAGFASGSFDYGALSSTDTHSIDTKVDDGLPENGKMISINGANTPGNCIVSSQYNVGEENTDCRLTFWLD